MQKRKISPFFVLLLISETFPNFMSVLLHSLMSLYPLSRYQMYSKDASFMDFPAPSLLHAIRFTFHAVISILIRHHWSITSSSPSISWSLYFQKGTELDCPFHKQLIHQSSNLIKAQNPCICGATLLIHSLALDGCNTLTSDMFIVNASLFIALDSCDLL